MGLKNGFAVFLIIFLFVLGESHTRGLLRMLVISRMGQLGHEATVAEARKRLEAHIAKAKEIPADLRSPVYR